MKSLESLIYSIKNRRARIVTCGMLFLPVASIGALCGAIMMVASVIFVMVDACKEEG